jgi:hypothetical protein
VTRCIGIGDCDKRLANEGANRFTIEIEHEKDGRWIAEIATLPGALAYGATRDEAIARVKALALRPWPSGWSAVSRPASSKACSKPRKPLAEISLKAPGVQPTYGCIFRGRRG